MTTATMTSKGQITVPKDIREELGLTPGSRVDFIRNSNGEIVLSLNTRHVTDLKGILRFHGRARTLEEMEAGIAQGAIESNT